MLLNSRGFTLIELLIVVAIIAILAAIAVPNFLEAQVRSKVSRVQTDLRTVATALESYKVDWNRYPADYVLTPSNPGDGALTSEGFLPPRLSTPISYLSTVALRDAFTLENMGGISASDPTNWPVGNLFYQSVEHSMRAAGVARFGPPVVREYQTQQPATAGYAGIKTGAGWGNGFPWEESYGMWKAGSIGPIRRYNGGANIYDVTNGTISSGDIYRTQLNPIGSLRN
jgi:prepilin-type N-terminal cleavage/methylation domain-containing protein